jgi:pantoate kinase
MTLDIELSPEAAKLLRERAAALGLDVATYAAKIVEEDLKKPTLDEIMAPVHDFVRKSGMTDAEIMDLGRAELKALRQEKSAKRPT